MNKRIVAGIIIALCMATLAPGFIYFQDNTVKADAGYTPHIVAWGEQTLATSSHRVRFPSVTLADNGDLVMIYTYSLSPIDYSCSNSVYSRISSDNGTTWGSAFLITTFSYYDGSWTLITAPNGDLLFLTCNDQEWMSHNGTDIWRNTNNGADGDWSYSGNFSEFGQCFIYDWVVFNDTIYAYVNDPGIFVGSQAYLAYSTDSGVTWAKYGDDMNFGTGEWSALPLDSDADHWITINRFTSTGSGPSGSSSCGADGPGLTYYPIREQYETTDGGLTWNDLNANCPESCGTAWMSSNQRNKGNHLFYLDDECIVANVETSSNYASLYISHDNMTSWGNYTSLGFEGSSAPKNAYGRGCALPKRAGDIGGWGFVVWSEQENTYVKGKWVANNASLVWTWPPGPAAESGSTPTTEQFNYINNATNGSLIIDPTRNYNGTFTSSILYYEIKIANDSAFTDVFLTIYVNSTTYPASFTETDAYYYVQDNNIISDSGGHGRHYYRFRPRYQMVTS